MNNFSSWSGFSLYLVSIKDQPEVVSCIFVSGFDVGGAGKIPEDKVMGNLTIMRWGSPLNIN